MVFLFLFFSGFAISKIWQKFFPKLAKLIKFTVLKNISKIFPFSFVEKKKFIVYMTSIEVY